MPYTVDILTERLIALRSVHATEGHAPSVQALRVRARELALFTGLIEAVQGLQTGLDAALRLAGATPRGSTTNDAAPAARSTEGAPPCP